MSFKRPQEDPGNSSTAKKPCIQTSQASQQYWQSELKTPLDRLTELCKNSRLIDLTISFPGVQEKLKAHRLMLAATSPVFECMFYGPMAEGEEFELQEDNMEAFKWLLQYIYYGIEDMPDVSTALQVYCLADKYQIDAVSALCSQYLQDNLYEDQLPLIYETVSVVKDKDLLHKCEMIMTFVPELLFSSTNLGLLSRENMKLFMEKELNIVSEVAVFNGLIKWGKAQESQTKGNHEPVGLRNTVQEFLPFVNFLSMSPDEYVEHVGPSNILTSDENLAILMNIIQLNSIPLPQLCRQAGRRKVMEKETACTLSLLRCKHSFCFSASSKNCIHQQVIADMEVNRYIYLGCIDLSFHDVSRNFLEIHFEKYYEWVIEVTDCAQRVIRKVKMNKLKTEFLSGIISVTFSPPLLLRPRMLYNIWIYSSMQSCESSKKFSFVESMLKITGSVWKAMGTRIRYWHGEESPQN